MRIYNRPFDERGNDFEKMWRFLIDDYAAKKIGHIWTIGRLGDWKYGLWNEQKYFPNFMRKNSQLWFNNFDELIGFVVSEDCNSGFTLIAKRGYEFIYSTIIDWVKDNWGNREGELITEVNEFQDYYIKELEKAGFRKKELACVTRLYNVADIAREPFILDKEFSVQDMLTNPDLEGKAVLYCNAWRNLDTASKVDLLRYEYNRESPCFNPRFDLSVVDSEGIHAAACVAFIDYENSYAEIEKVCTHKAYRRRGLAETVIRECFRRLNEDGIEHAYITGYSTAAISLYGKLKHVKSKNWFEYALSKQD